MNSKGSIMEGGLAEKTSKAQAYMAKDGQLCKSTQDIYKNTSTMDA
jgi:hypothetical protein